MIRWFFFKNNVILFIILMPLCFFGGSEAKAASFSVSIISCCDIDLL